jgi:phenylpropionate dioxygenase-like ring-hydroxylating dioxygenase large terminal subunit
MLGLDFVLFRDSEGQAHCLHDVCVHRGSSLSHGKLKGDCVECPYHGWQYDGSGTCKRIPSLDQGQKIPPRAKVDSYPTMEKYGLVFAFLGDLPEEERPPLLECKEWEQEGWAPSLQVVDNLEMNYQRHMENGVDCTHNDFVHPMMHVALDRRGKRPVRIEGYEESEWAMGYYSRIPSVQFDKKNMKVDYSKGEGSGIVYQGTVGASSNYAFINPQPDFRLRQYFYEVPIDEKHTRFFLLTMRSFMPDEAGEKQMIDSNAYVAWQDIEILTEVRPNVPAPSNVTEVLVPGDRPVAGYRKLRKIWQDYGWRIDLNTVRENEADGPVYAIPSPGRRTSKNWAISSIPLLPARNQRKSSAA